MTQTPFSLILLSKNTIACNTLELRFRKPDSFVFAAGQFVQVLVPHNGQETPRSYSISSAPAAEELELCVKILAGGLASAHFTDLSVGEEISVRGPLGRFTNTALDTPLAFVATGVGLAPIMGIIEDELHNKKNTRSVQLLFGVRSEQDIFWLDRLEQLQKQFSNFSYTVTISQPDDSWTGSRGRVTEHSPMLNASAHFFLCGSADMVKDVRKQLMDRAVLSTDIHLEVF